MTVVAALPGFGGGTGEIFIDNTRCNGSEDRLEQCPHHGIGNHNCAEEGHNDDSGVICFSGYHSHIYIYISLIIFSLMYLNLNLNLYMAICT